MLLSLREVVARGIAQVVVVVLVIVVVKDLSAQTVISPSPSAGDFFFFFFSFFFPRAQCYLFHCHKSTRDRLTLLLCFDLFFHFAA